MAEAAQIQSGAQAALFTETPARVPVGSSIVLLATAMSQAPSPTHFQDIADGPPENFLVLQDTVVIDYKTLQCLVVPGERLRMQVQWTEGRSIAEVKEFAHRFFRFGLGPQVLGVNFGYRFDFVGPGLERVAPLLNIARINDLGLTEGAELTQAGIKLKSEGGGWRTLLTIDPGANPRQLNWSVNFERDAGSDDAVREGIDSLDELAQRRETLVGRLRWID